MESRIKSKTEQLANEYLSFIGSGQFGKTQLSATDYLEFRKTAIIELSSGIASLSGGTDEKVPNNASAQKGSVRQEVSKQQIVERTEEKTEGNLQDAFLLMKTVKG